MPPISGMDSSEELGEVFYPRPSVSPVKGTVIRRLGSTSSKHRSTSRSRQKVCKTANQDFVEYPLSPKSQDVSEHGVSQAALDWVTEALRAQRQSVKVELECRHEAILKALESGNFSPISSPKQESLCLNSLSKKTDAVDQVEASEKLDFLPGSLNAKVSNGEEDNSPGEESATADITRQVSNGSVASSRQVSDGEGGALKRRPTQFGASNTVNKVLSVSTKAEMMAEEGYPIWHPTRIVEEWWSEAFFVGIICLNTLVLAVEVQYAGMKRGYQLGYPRFNKPAEELWPHAEDVFLVLEWFFGIVFTLELMLKIVGYGMSFIYELWNWFDAVIVAFWLVDTILSGFITIEKGVLKLARMARLLRLLRLVRAIQGFDALYIMTTAMKGSLSVLWWSFVLLMIVQILLSFFLNQILDLYYFNDDSHPLDKRWEVFAYFGTTTRGLLTMFELTLANWPTASRILVEHVSEWYTLFSVTHKLTIGFAVIGVINGVFMQETFKVAGTDDFIMLRQKERDKKLHTKKMQLLFTQADSSGDGVLDMEEFRSILSNAKVKTWLSAQELRIEDCEKLFRLIDDGDEELTAEELVDGVARLKGAARAVDFLTFMREDQQFKEQVCKKMGIKMPK